MSQKITAANTRKAFERKNQVEFRSGKEPTGWVKHEGTKISRITIPKGDKEIPIGTLKSMARYLEVSDQQFVDYVACKINGAQLIEFILQNKTKSSQ